MADQPIHMLRYWIDDKGIDTAFADYFPELAKEDPEIQQALTMRKVATKALMARVAELEDEAPYSED